MAERRVSFIQKTIRETRGKMDGQRICTAILSGALRTPRAPQATLGIPYELAPVTALVNFWAMLENAGSMPPAK
jgi:hypothetical protein